jgi:hypothetical protein
MVLLRGESILIRPIVPCAVTSVKSGFQGQQLWKPLLFDDASKMTSEALFEQVWNSRVMPHGGRREGAGRPRGSGNGPTVETQQRLAAAQDLAIDRRNARNFEPWSISFGGCLPVRRSSLYSNSSNAKLAATTVVVM